MHASGYIVGKVMKRSKEKKGPKVSGTLPACCRHFSNTHRNMDEEYRYGVFYINDAIMPCTL